MTPSTVRNRHRRRTGAVLLGTAAAAAMAGALTALPAQAAPVAPDAAQSAPEAATAAPDTAPAAADTAPGAQDVADAAKRSGARLTISFNQTIGDASLGGGLAGSLGLGVVTSGGGSLSRVSAADGSTSAVRTPAYDGSASGPRAILDISSRGDDVLSPGTGDLLLRADVSLDAVSFGGSSTDNGDNVLQRGLYNTMQYKLQVDHRVPSCRVSGSDGAVMVYAPAELSPGGWYRLACSRDDSVLTLTVKQFVDGSWRGQSTTRASGSIGTVRFGASVPLSVGGKLNDNGTVVSSASDQFNGRYANLLVQVG